MSRWLKITLKITAVIVVLLILIPVGIMLYITYNKAKILSLVNVELNKDLDGKMTIGDMRPQLFNHFPNISLELRNVLVQDNRFAEHHHTLLDAKNFYIAVNTAALLTGTVNVREVNIDNAAIDLYTDSTGYSNTSVFKTKSKKKNGASGGRPGTELEKFSLVNVGFKVDDEQKHKLFDFVVNNIRGRMAYPDTGWHATFHLDVIAKSMAFKTSHGSFIHDKAVEGDFVAGYNEKSGRISVVANALDIADDPFKINAYFETGKNPASFVFHIASPKLLWRHASALLSANITKKLDQFNIDQPLDVTAIISGSFSGGGDPFLYVTAKIRNSLVSTPGGNIDNCSFNGIFTNGFEKGKEFSDDNSVIRLISMTGNYQHMPFTIDTGSIINLNKPIATGNFRADFPASDLNYIIGSRVAKFTKGTADMNLRYKADIVNYELNKPLVSGIIHLKNADIVYIPENLKLKNSSLTLNFTHNDLLFKDIRLQSGQSVVFMEGRINNFMNLYYDAPEKIVLNWQIHSPQLYLGEFLGFLSGVSDKPAVKTKANGNSGNVIDQMSIALEKGGAEMHLDVDKVHYFKFLATDAHADLLTTENGVDIKNVRLKHAGGFLKLSGSIRRGSDLNKLSLKTVVSHVDVHEFFEAFENFGLKDFTSENLRGFLSARTQITAGLTDEAKLVPGTVNGTLDVNLQDGALVNFNPIGSVAKFAFPRRDLKNIKVPLLDAHFDVNGEMITVHPMKLSSSVLNMDIAGVYGLKNGTDLAMDVPLRNPKNDSTITNADKLAKKRYKGIVLHIRAKADSTGKIKIGWNKNQK
jgi:hypothetical protein